MIPRRLLLVDAAPAVHERLTGLLRREGRTIQNARDGREALARLRDSAYDLIVAGQGRNGSDGLKLLRNAHAIRPQTKIILTGDEDPARVLEAIREQAYSYFHEPVSEGPLADMVQQALDSSSWLDDVGVISARADYIILEVHCKFEAAERTTHFVRELEVNLPDGACEDVAAAFRELLMNAIEHGGKSDPEKKVRLALIHTRRSLIGHISDPGEGFSLDLLPHAAISNPGDSPTRHLEVRQEQGQRPGGFGILMTRNLVDELVYSERGNDVVFVKYFAR